MTLSSTNNEKLIIYSTQHKLHYKWLTMHFHHVFMCICQINGSLKKNRKSPEKENGIMTAQVLAGYERWQALCPLRGISLIESQYGTYTCQILWERSNNLVLQLCVIMQLMNDHRLFDTSQSATTRPHESTASCVSLYTYRQPAGSVACGTSRTEQNNQLHTCNLSHW